MSLDIIGRGEERTRNYPGGELTGCKYNTIQYQEREASLDPDDFVFVNFSTTTVYSSS